MTFGQLNFFQSPVIVDLKRLWNRVNREKLGFYFWKIDSFLVYSRSKLDIFCIKKFEITNDLSDFKLEIANLTARIHFGTWKFDEHKEIRSENDHFWKKEWDIKPVLWMKIFLNLMKSWLIESCSIFRTCENLKDLLRIYPSLTVFGTQYNFLLFLELNLLKSSFRSTLVRYDSLRFGTTTIDFILIPVKTPNFRWNFSIRTMLYFHGIHP